MLTPDQRSEKARKGQEQNRQIRELLAGQGATFISNDLQEEGRSILGSIFAEWRDGRTLPGVVNFTVHLGSFDDPRAFSKVRCSFSLFTGTPAEAAALAPLIVKVSALAAQIEQIISS